MARRSDGSMTSKRGFSSPKAARDARRRFLDRQERGEVRHTKESFGAFWERWLARRKPYLEAGTWQAYERDGRLRLVPALGPLALSRLDVDAVRELMDQMAEAVEAEDLAPKTVNNTLGTLVVCLNAAFDDGLIAQRARVRDALRERKRDRGRWQDGGAGQPMAIPPAIGASVGSCSYVKRSPEIARKCSARHRVCNAGSDAFADVCKRG